MYELSVHRIFLPCYINYNVKGIKGGDIEIGSFVNNLMIGVGLGSVWGEGVGVMC